VRGAQALAWFEAGRIADAVGAAQAADEDARRLGFDQHPFAVDYLRVLAGAALERRDLDTAERLTERALSIAERFRPVFEFFALLDRAQIWAARGQIDTALATTDAARRVGDLPVAMLTLSGDDEADWIALSALQEPSLFALRQDSTSQVYRFLWLPSFHRPISIRLTISTDGTGAIVARSVDTRAGLLTKAASDTGDLILDKAVAIDKIQVQDVLQRLQLLAFWSLPSEEEQESPPSSGGSSGPRVRVVHADGSQWILEGLREGQYHVVDRWSPQDSSYSEFCRHLLQLGKVETSLY